MTARAVFQDHLERPPLDAVSRRGIDRDLQAVQTRARRSLTYGRLVGFDYGDARRLSSRVPQTSLITGDKSDLDYDPEHESEHGKTKRKLQRALPMRVPIPKDR